MDGIQFGNILPLLLGILLQLRTCLHFTHDQSNQRAPTQRPSLRILLVSLTAFPCASVRGKRM